MTAIVTYLADWLDEHTRQTKKSDQVLRVLADMSTAYYLAQIEQRLRASKADTEANPQAVA